jgi:hypothetical protein
MTHQDSSESDELRPDLFAPGAAPLPAPEPVVTPAANAQPERPIAPFVRTLYALLEGPYDETLCEWSENGRRIVFPDPTQFAETVCPQCFRHSKWTSFSRMLNMYDFRKVSSTPRSGAAPARAGLAPMVFEHDSFRRGGQGELYLVQRRKRKKPEDAQREAVWKSTSELGWRPSSTGRMETTSRRWRGIYTPSSRRSYGDDVA